MLRKNSLVAMHMDTVSKCMECSKHRTQLAEPLIPSTLPEWPWQKVASDLFEWSGTTYLLVIDYH